MVLVGGGFRGEGLVGWGLCVMVGDGDWGFKNGYGWGGVWVRVREGYFRNFFLGLGYNNLFFKNCGFISFFVERFETK